MSWAAVVANAREGDETFAQGVLLWIVKGPRPGDDRLAVMGPSMHGQATRRRHPDELELLRVEGFYPSHIPKAAVSWDSGPRNPDRPPAWVGPLSCALAGLVLSDRSCLQATLSEGGARRPRRGPHR